MAVYSFSELYLVASVNGHTLTLSTNIPLCDLIGFCTALL